MLRVIQAIFILAAAFQQSAAAITVPVEGQTLQGQATISGTIEAANFGSAELAFGYASDPTDTWFLIQVISQPPQDGVLAAWDTTNLTDGDYRLRLRVFAPDGSYQDYFVNDLHLRNQAPLPTITPSAEATAAPAPEESAAAPEFESTASDTPLPVTVLATRAPLRATPLPPNPAGIAADSVYSIMGRAALMVLILFIVLGGFLRLRRS